MVRILFQRLLEGKNEARFADTGLSADERHATLASFDLAPASLQKSQFLLATNQLDGF